MKHIQTFENFVTDDNRGEETEFPQHNQALKQEITEYVDSILNSNDFNTMFQVVGMKMPQDVSGEDLDKVFDEVRELAIQHYIKNPEEVKQAGYTLKTFTTGEANDGIVRTNKVGGALRESARPIPHKKGTKLLSVTNDELKYFQEEEPLTDLVRNDKVVLYDNEIWYNTNDSETIDILSVYFDLK